MFNTPTFFIMTAEKEEEDKVSAVFFQVPQVMAPEIHNSGKWSQFLLRFYADGCNVTTPEGEYLRSDPANALRNALWSASGYLYEQDKGYCTEWAQMMEHFGNLIETVYRKGITDPQLIYADIMEAFHRNTSISVKEEFRSVKNQL